MIDQTKRLDPSLKGDEAIAKSGRNAWLEIDVNKLRNNFYAVRNMVGRDAKIMGVVKANAYGHGMSKVSRILVDEGVYALGVAILQEAIELREDGIDVPILVFGGVQAGQEDLAVRYDITPSVYSSDVLHSLSIAACKQNKLAKYHLKIDTGMGRVGIDDQNIESFLADADAFDSVELEGIYSHLSSADEDDSEYTLQQIQRFNHAISYANSKYDQKVMTHISNSAAIVHHPIATFDMVRAGIILYGVSPKKDSDVSVIEPVLSVKSVISFVKSVPAGTPIGYGRSFTTGRESIIATVPIGYADGISRAMSNKGKVIVGGRLSNVCGLINMDSLMIDVTDIPEAKLGEEVVLIGHQGNCEITSYDVASWSATVPHDVLSTLGYRLPRYYLDNC